MKVAIYLRVSTQEQNTENQEAKLISYAKSKDWEYEIFRECESTRKTRPVKELVLNLLRKKNFQGVLVYKLDRWARSTSELILGMEEFHKKGIGFTSYTDNIDFETASGKLFFRILSSFAEFERDLISERTKEALARLKREGKILGRPKKDIKEYPNFCQYPKCRIRVKKTQAFCKEHKKTMNILQKNDHLREVKNQA